MCTRRGPLRNKLMHRLAMADLCREWCYYLLKEDGLPAGFDVHHVDFNRLNYCSCNLLLLQTKLHMATNRMQAEAVRQSQSASYTNFEAVID